MRQYIPFERRYSGEEFERDMMGQIKPEAIFPLEEKTWQKGKFPPFAEALRFAKENQPWDPTNPGTDFLRELRLAVIEKLGLSDKDADNIKAFTAVGRNSPLDQLFGIDGFIEALLPRWQKPEIVTMDATMRSEEEKLEKKHPADLIVRPLPDPEEGEQKYLAAIDAIANEVVEKLREKHHRPED